MTKKNAKTAIALILIIAISVTIVALPDATAQGTKKTFARIGATPNPIGVGQTTVIRFGITDQLALLLYGWSGLTVTVTKPDGTTETLGPFKTDSTGGTWVSYTPSTVGNYTLQLHFPQQVN